VIGGRVRPGAAAAQHPGQRLAGVIAVPQQGMMAEALEIRLSELLVQLAQVRVKVCKVAPAAHGLAGG
jgi:hypothetical protein